MSGRPASVPATWSGLLPPARAEAFRRTSRLAAAGLVLVAALAGCMPAVMGGLALLGGGGGGGSDGSAQSGPFAGRPHPVQNARPATPGAEELQSVVDKGVLESCREKLPEPQPALPASGCVLRPSCLQGMTAPMTLRVCARPGPADAT